MSDYIAYCDGSFRKDKNIKAGASVAIIINLTTNQKEIFTSCGKFASSSDAERIAINLAIDNTPKNSNLTILSDCSGYITRFNGEAKSSNHNQITKIRNKFNNICFEWIPSHNPDTPIHQEADRLARKIVRTYFN